MSLFIFSFLTLLQPVSAQNKLQKIADTYRDSLKFYGISVLVAKDGTVEQADIGYSYRNEPLKQNQSFGIGSITKTFIATIVLKLQEQNLLNINDHIGKYIDPQNKFIDTTISVRELLNHSSGIKDCVPNGFTNFYLMNPKLILTQRELLNQIDSIEFAKGTKHEYSNSNFFLLGLIIEKITDEPLEKVISDMIITPYHLTNTYPIYTKDIKTLARPMQNGLDLSQFISYQTINKETEGAGQIISCTHDLYTFFKLLFKDKKILNQQSLNEMLTFEKNNAAGDDDEYGLGIFRIQTNGKDFINHTGRVISYGARAYYIPQDDLFLITLTNNMDDIYSGKIKTQVFVEYLK